MPWTARGILPLIRNLASLQATARIHLQIQFLWYPRALRVPVVSLKPGQDWRNTLRVSNLYDLSTPGQYTIQVRRWDDETKTWVNPTRLR